MDGAAIPYGDVRDEPHRFLIHDHDSIYSEKVDGTIAAMGLTILKTRRRKRTRSASESLVRFGANAWTAPSSGRALISR